MNMPITQPRSERDLRKILARLRESVPTLTRAFREANFLFHPTALLWSGGCCEHPPKRSMKVVLPTRGQTVSVVGAVNIRTRLR
jgi:hypothetical protein